MSCKIFVGRVLEFIKVFHTLVNSAEFVVYGLYPLIYDTKLSFQISRKLLGRFSSFWKKKGWKVHTFLMYSETFINSVWLRKVPMIKRYLNILIMVCNFQLRLSYFIPLIQFMAHGWFVWFKLSNNFSIIQLIYCSELNKLSFLVWAPKVAALNFMFSHVRRPRTGRRYSCNNRFCLVFGGRTSPFW